MPTLRWGILGGSSRISRKAVAPAIEASGRGEVVAVASRDPDGSDAPYAALLGRGDVDIVYIPLPNGLHVSWVRAALAWRYGQAGRQTAKTNRQSRLNARRL